MKTKLGSLLSIISVVFLLTACSEDIMDNIDTDPNNPVDVPVRILLPQVTSGVAFNVSGTDLSWFSSMFVEYTTGVHGTMENIDKRLAITSALSENPWLYIYTGVLTDLNIIIDKCSENGSEPNNYISKGIAEVLMAYSMATVTDMWGKVPYSEALMGSSNRKPKFDKQKEIYLAIIDLLDDAIADFNNSETAVIIGGEDFIYSGDKKKWTKAAWALKARYYNRMAQQETDYLQKAIDCVPNAFANSGDDMLFSAFATDLSKANPWYQEAVSKGHFAVSKTFYDLLSDLAYPVKDDLFTKISGSVVPATNGLAIEDESGRKYSKISGSMLTATTPIPLMTFAELKFIEAEAQYKLTGTSNQQALNAFQSALITTIEDKGIDNQIQRFNYVVSQAENINDLTIDLIIKHKYISLWPFQAVEAYCDWRRTGIPTLVNPQAPPRRLPYPQSEINSNPDNCTDNSKALDQGVWWDDGTDD